MKTHTRLFIAALFAVSFLLAACGGGGAAQTGPLNVTVTGTEFAFDPATITVKAGQEVNLTFKNAGTVDHSLNILKKDAELEHVLEEEDEEHLHEELLFDIHEVAAGGSETETFTAPTEPGDYVIACLVAGHAGAGMVGTLTVTP